MKPDVSIIIPTFNRESLILKTLESVQNQIFKNWVCYIVDDGSTDQSKLKIEEFIKDDKRFIFLERKQNRKKGASTCRNIGLEHANTKYIQFLDSDDLMSENKIQEQIFLLENKDEYTLATSKWGTFNEEYRLYENLPSYSNFNNTALFLNALTHSKGYFPIHSYLINRKLIQLSGYWNENIKLNDDGEFIMRIISNTSNIVCSLKSTAWYRQKTRNNLSDINDKNNIKIAIESWKLISGILKIRFEESANHFLDWSIGRFFINVKKSFPDLINSNKDFFEIHIEEEKNKNNLIRRINNKIKKIGR
jgi:glycosyltransferase involved in cell wall biosynthesis